MYYYSLVRYIYIFSLLAAAAFLFYLHRNEQRFALDRASTETLDYAILSAGKIGAIFVSVWLIQTHVYPVFIPVNTRKLLMFMRVLSTLAIVAALFTASRSHEVPAHTEKAALFLAVVITLFFSREMVNSSYIR